MLSIVSVMIVLRTFSQNRLRLTYRHYPPVTNLDSLEKAVKVMSATQLFSLAESLGGVESLIGHPASMTHASIPIEERRKTGVLDSLIRLSIGIEDAEDLIDDLAQALEQSR